MRDWSKEFNDLPYETRVIGAAMELRTRIQQLTMERGRLTEAYREATHNIDIAIKNHEESLKKLEA